MLHFSRKPRVVLPIYLAVADDDYSDTYFIINKWVIYYVLRYVRHSTIVIIIIATDRCI